MCVCITQTISWYHVWINSSTFLGSVTKLAGQVNEAGRRCQRQFLTLTCLPTQVPLHPLHYEPCAMMPNQAPFSKHIPHPMPWLLLTCQPRRLFQFSLICSGPLVKTLFNYQVSEIMHFSHSMFSQSTVLSLIQYFIWSPYTISRGLSHYAGILAILLIVVPQSDRHWPQNNAGHLASAE